MSDRLTDIRALHYGVPEPDYTQLAENRPTVTVCYEDGSLWPCDAGYLVESLQAALEREALLSGLVAEALPIMEDEWIGTEGPIGDGGAWIVKAREALAAAAARPTGAAGGEEGQNERA